MWLSFLRFSAALLVGVGGAAADPSDGDQYGYLFGTPTVDLMIDVDKGEMYLMDGVRPQVTFRILEAELGKSYRGEADDGSVIGLFIPRPETCTVTLVTPSDSPLGQTVTNGTFPCVKY